MTSGYGEILASQMHALADVPLKIPQSQSLSNWLTSVIQKHRNLECSHDCVCVHNQRSGVSKQGICAEQY